MFKLNNEQIFKGLLIMFKFIRVKQYYVKNKYNKFNYVYNNHG